MLVRQCKRLKGRDLLALVCGEIAAIRVKKFIPKTLCEGIAETMTTSPLFGHYANPGAENIGRLGEAFFERQTSPEAQARYDRESMSWMRELRAALAPMLSPIDKLRVELDEAWPHGAKIARIDGVKLFSGLGRVFGEGSCAEPHQDVIYWDAVGSKEAARIAFQLAANVYLSMPKRGGALMIWPESLSHDQYEAYRIPGSYGVRQDCLASEPLIIHPEVGELILFDSRKVHAVARIEDGSRYTFSTFIGLEATTSPMALFS